MNEGLLTPKQVKVLQALSTGETVSAAAQAANVTERTVYRWLREDHLFRVELKRMKGEILARVEGGLIMLAEGAVKGLKEVLEKPGMPGANTKRLTCVAILELALKWHEHGELLERVEELERTVKNDH